MRKGLFAGVAIFLASIYLTFIIDFYMFNSVVGDTVVFALFVVLAAIIVYLRHRLLKPKDDPKIVMLLSVTLAGIMLLIGQNTFLPIANENSKTVLVDFKVVGNSDTAQLREVWLTSVQVDGEEKPISQLLVKENHNWEYIEEYDDFVFLPDGNNADNILTISVNAKEIVFNFISSPWSGNVSISYGGNETEVDLFSEEEGINSYTLNTKTSHTYGLLERLLYNCGIFVIWYFLFSLVLTWANVTRNMLKENKVNLLIAGIAIVVMGLVSNMGMSLFSVAFLVFLMITAGIYFSVPKRYQWKILLAASYIFYAFAGIKIMFFLMLTTVSTWGGGIWLDKLNSSYKMAVSGMEISEKKRMKEIFTHKKRKVLASILVLNFGILAIVKYTNFFIENVNVIFQNYLTQPINVIHFLLPLGISFYTFQSMGYLIDIYRGKYACDRNPFKFALFVSYFPQIIQGPISRYSDLSKELYEEHSFDYERVKFGIQRMMWGYFKKVVIADRIAVFANEVFTNYASEGYAGFTVFIGVALYSVQIYADFSGGMDIICGVSQIFGVNLIENFKRPFMARSVAEFWQRWHITLGAWMRDYLFYPLALSKNFGKLSKALKKLCGNYVAKVLPTCLASFIVFLIVGIWHGAAWKYVVYGLYQATFVSTATLLEPFYSKCRMFFRINIATTSWKIFQMLRTCFIVVIGRYFSRGDTLYDALQMLKATFSEFNPWVFFDGSLYSLGLNEKNFMLMIVLIIFLFMIDSMQERGIRIRERIAREDIVVRWCIYFAGIFAIIIFGMYGIEYNSSNFIYAGF